MTATEARGSRSSRSFNASLTNSQAWASSGKWWKPTSNKSAAVRFAKHGLEGEDVRRHVKEGGKSVTQHGLTWNDRERLVLADPGVVRRVRFEMIEQDRAENEPTSNKDDQFDADFALMCGELTLLLDDLLAALGGEAQKK